MLVATDDGRLRQVTINDDQPLTSWQLNDLGAVQAVAWDDLDKDGRPDTGLVGTRDGSVWLYDRLYTRAPQRILELPLGSGVFHVALLKRASSQSPDILTITQNGLVRLFQMCIRDRPATPSAGAWSGGVRGGRARSPAPRG